jgi:hypothetical protein
MYPGFTNLDDAVLPQVITDFVRQLQFPNYELDEFFPGRSVLSNEFRWDSTLLKQEPAVRYRAWDTEVEIGDRQAPTRASQELPPLGKKKIMTEEQQLKLQAMQFQDWTGYISQIYADVENLTDGVNARWEIDRGALLSSGSLTIQGNGYTAQIDYPVPSGNKVTAGTLWSDVVNSDPISDLKAWVVAYRLQNRGMSPGLILISDVVATYMLRNHSLRTAIYPIGGLGPTVLDVEAVQNQFRANSLPPFRIINSQATDENGNFNFVLAQNKLIMVPSNGNDIGYTVTGVTGSALGMVNKGTMELAEAPGLVGLTWDEDDPPRRFNMIDGCGMPVLSNPNLLFIATVG